MIEDYPFEDGRNLSWTLEGFGPDEWLCSSVTVTREQFLEVRGLFELGDNEWMVSGDYPVPPDVQAPLKAVIGMALFEEGVDYFLGTREDLSSGTGPPSGRSEPFLGLVPLPGDPQPQSSPGRLQLPNQVG
ncbi:hypothetical protein AB0M57_22695 [Streptomyces sp. NPDC051597]|uniref:hypothetical protein n=1 Tax=Streptomyces sp. NPDC051597 TaxID=3155049 RepID=UPI003434AAA7